MNLLDWEKTVKNRYMNMKYNVKEKNRNLFYEIKDYGAELESVEENIALWWVGYRKVDNTRVTSSYFYTDLEGNILFGGNTFFFATPFSNGLALVSDKSSGYYLLDINKREKLLIPKETNIIIPCNFRNGLMSVQCNNKNYLFPKWGSYMMDYKEKTLECVIPFIWDYLSISRRKDKVFAGRLDGYYNDGGNDVRSYVWDSYYDCHGWNTQGWDDYEPTNIRNKLKKQYRYYVSQMSVEQAQNDKYISCFLGLIPNHEDPRYQAWLYTFVEDVGGLLDEKIDENLCTNDGMIVKTSNLDDYQKILCRLKNK